MALTKLTSKEFFHCLILAILNLFGVIWFAQSLEPDGVLEPLLSPAVTKALQATLIPVLSFYAKLFFAIPGVRLVFTLGQNEFIRGRNHCRLNLSRELSLESNMPQEASGADKREIS